MLRKSVITLILILSSCTIYSQSFIEWKASFNGPSNFDDYVNAMTIDFQGNVIVTGYCNSVSSRDMYTVKYSSAGVQQWVIHSQGQGSSPHAEGTAVLTDAVGNVYVAGEISNSSNQYDVILFKYNSAGSLLWQSTFDNPAAGSSIIKMQFDVSGDLYLLGVSGGYLIMIYSSSGTRLWYTISTVSGSNFSLPSFAVDNGGNIFLCGAKYDFSSSTSNAYVAKYSNTHNLVWERPSGLWGTSGSTAIDIGLDNSGNCYFTGDLRRPGYQGDVFTAKYSSSGDSLWGNVFNCFGTWSRFSYMLKMDQFSNAYVAFLDSNASGVLKYDNGGNLLWHTRISQMNETVVSSAIDQNGGLLIASNYRLAKMSPAGIIQYIYRTNYIDSIFVKSVAINPTGNVFVSGDIVRVISDYDFVTAKYSLTIGIQQISSEVPTGFSLNQNYPNPFNPETRIQFSVPPLKGGRGMTTTKVVVFDILGREVETLVNQSLQPGTYEVSWDASKYPSGVYFYSLSTDGFRETKKMVLVK